MGLILIVVLVTSRSKSCQKVENRQKVQKASKVGRICKGHWFGRTFTKAPVLYQQRTQAFVGALTVFRALFAGSKSSFDTTFKAITNMAKLIELLILYHVFPQWEEIFRAENNQILYQLNGISAPSSYLRNTRPPSATSILKMRSGRRRLNPGSGQKCLIGQEDV